MTSWFQNQHEINQVSVADRGLQYGDGLFETVAIRRGSPRLWDLHIARLSRGCERLGLPMPDPLQLHSAVAAALDESDVDDNYCLAKILLTAGSGGRGYGRAGRLTPTLAIGVFPSAPLPASVYEDGVSTTICDTRLAGPAATAGLKTLNRLEQVLARAEIGNDAVFEGLTLDEEDNIICGTMSNIFLVCGSRIVTPSLTRCGVAGVMREHLIASLGQTGNAVTIAEFSMCNLEDVDEVFLTNSQFGILPVSDCDQMHWSARMKTRSIMSVLEDSGIVEPVL